MMLDAKGLMNAEDFERRIVQASVQPSASS